MNFPAGFVWRLRSAVDAQKTSRQLDVKHTCNGREITFLEPFEVSPLKPEPWRKRRPAPAADAVPNPVIDFRPPPSASA